MLLKEFFPLVLTPQQLSESYSPDGGGAMVIKNVLLQKANAKNRNGRIYPKEVLAREINKYITNFVDNNRALGELDHCFCSNNFDVLTENGWKTFEDVQLGEKVLSYNIHTKKYEYKKVLKIINKEFSGESYTIKGRHIDTQVTENHKFIIKDRYGNEEFVTIKDIYENRKKYNKSQIIKTGEIDDSDKPDRLTLTVPDYKYKNRIKNSQDFNIDTDILAGIIGIWLAEGYYKKTENTGRLDISQNAGSKLDRIIDLLNEGQLEYSVYKNPNVDEAKRVVSIKHNQIYHYIGDLGNTYTKYIPKDVKKFKNSSLKKLIDFFILGDGRHQEHKHGIRENMFTVSKRLIDDLQECLIISGGSGNITIGHKAGNVGGDINGKPVIATKDLYQLNVSSVKGIYLDSRFVKIEKVNHTGKIYCLEVEDNHSFYVRQNNKCFITGNSSEPQVNLKNVSHNIKKIWWDGDNVYGNIEILDGPEFPAGRIAAGLLRRSIPVGISSRALGSTEQIDENTVKVNDDLALSCFDLVSYESTIGSNFTLNEGYNQNNINKYKNLDDIIHEIICNNSNVCSCMFDKK